MEIVFNDISEVIFVNFQKSYLHKINSFDSVEKTDIREKKGIVYKITLCKNNDIVKIFNYDDDINERDNDYRKVNDVLISLRSAIISRIVGESKNGKKNTQYQKTRVWQKDY